MDKVNGSGEKTNSRIESLDLLRSFAIFCVILTHVTEYTYPINGYLSHRSVYSRLLALGLHTFGRLGVPIFFFLTGYLLLDRDYSGTKAVKFWKSHLLPMIITSEIWGGIYFVYQITSTDALYSVDSLLQELLMFRQFDGSAFWYIPVIVGIYIFIPFVSYALHMQADRKTFFVPLIFAFLFLFIPPVINMFRNLSGLDEIGTKIDFSFIGNAYGFLIILGYMIKKNMFNKVPKKLLTFIAVCAFVIIVILRNRLCEIGHLVDVWYNSGLLLIIALSVFLCVLPIKQIHFKHMFEWISKNSFGMYLIHELFCKIFSNLIVVDHLWIKEIILLVTVCGGTLATVCLLGINKKVARIFLYAR